MFFFLQNITFEIICLESDGLKLSNKKSKINKEGQTTMDILQEVKGKVYIVWFIIHFTTR